MTDAVGAQQRLRLPRAGPVGAPAQRAVAALDVLDEAAVTESARGVDGNQNSESAQNSGAAYLY